jgi:RNA polymerase sigma-70 factor (ECF subfamily)
VGSLDVPEAWVRRVLVNLLIDQQRRRQRDQLLVERLGPPALVPAPVTDDERWWDAVRSLPDRQRAVITLHYLEDRSVREVADILEIAPGTVKATLSHARDRLRQVLVQEDTR